MTIAKSLALLLALPIVVLVALGGYLFTQMNGIEKKSGFVSDLQIESLAALANIARQNADMRVNVRNYLLADDAVEVAEAAADLAQHREEMTSVLDHYGDSLISDDADRRQYTEFRQLNREWTAEAQKLLSLAANGHRREARAEIISGDVLALGKRLGVLLAEWIAHNQALAREAGHGAIDAIQASERNLIMAVGAAMLLSWALGYFTFRRIVIGIGAVQATAAKLEKAIREGDSEVPKIVAELKSVLEAYWSHR
jgi:CHASE3 domain sensor protein